MSILAEMERKKIEAKAKPCTCNSYKFPHRRGSGSCNDDYKWMDLSDLAKFEKWQKYSESYK